MGKTKTKLLSTSAPCKEPAAPSTAEAKPVDTGIDVRASEPAENVAPLPLKPSRGRPQKPRGPPSASAQPRKFLSYEDLLARGINFSRVHLRRLSLEGHFPASLKLGSDACQTTVCWVAAEVEAWEDQRIRERDAKVAARQKTSATG
jgi:predicted DNA-binding transcriptional regulator AlpA